MIDLGRWIYSNDIAEWLMNREPLSLEEQIDCICSAPHRTMAEKLEELKRLNSLYKEDELCDKIKCIEALMHRVCSNVPMQQYLYGTEVYYHGEKEWFCHGGILRTAKKATEEIKRQIRKSAEQDCLAKEFFYGVIHVLHEIAPYEYRNKENPFLSPLKGVIVNSIEPDENGFSDSSYNQWIVYPDFWHIDRTNGIGIVNLHDDYVPFPSNPDLMPPYKQFISRYDGDLREKEAWLREISELVKADKDCVRTMLADRQPGSSDVDQRRLAYVRNLMIRARQRI